MNKKTELTIIKETETDIVIKDNAGLERATLILSRLNTYLDGLITEKEKVTKPMLLALKNERARFKPLEEKLESAISKIRAELSRYATEIERRKQAIADRVKSGSGNLSVEKGLEKMEKISIADETVTDNGSLKFRDTPTLEIFDSTLIPRLYLVPAEKDIMTALKKGIEVLGCRIITVKTPINYRA